MNITIQCNTAPLSGLPDLQGALKMEKRDGHFCFSYSLDEGSYQATWFPAIDCEDLLGPDSLDQGLISLMGIRPDKVTFRGAAIHIRPLMTSGKHMPRQRRKVGEAYTITSERT